VLSAASFKAARTLARDEVTSFIREPFVRGQAWSLAAAGINDFLRAGFAAVTERSG
jgi:hypothetical protein